MPTQDRLADQTEEDFDRAKSQVSDIQNKTQDAVDHGIDGVKKAKKLYQQLQDLNGGESANSHLAYGPQAPAHAQTAQAGSQSAADLSAQIGTASSTGGAATGGAAGTAGGAAAGGAAAGGAAAGGAAAGGGAAVAAGAGTVAVGAVAWPVVLIVLGIILIVVLLLALERFFLPSSVQNYDEGQLMVIMDEFYTEVEGNDNTHYNREGHYNIRELKEHQDGSLLDPFSDSYGEFVDRDRNQPFATATRQILQIIDDAFERAWEQSYRDMLYIAQINDYHLRLTTESYNRAKEENIDMFEDVNYAQILNIINTNDSMTYFKSNPLVFKSFFATSQQLRLLYRLKIDETWDTKLNLGLCYPLVDENGNHVLNLPEDWDESVEIADESPFYIWIDADTGMICDPDEMVKYGIVTLHPFYLNDLYRLAGMGANDDSVHIPGVTVRQEAETGEYVYRTFVGLGVDDEELLGPYTSPEWDGEPQSTLADFAYDPYEVPEWEDINDNMPLQDYISILEMDDDEVILNMPRYINQGDYPNSPRGSGASTIKQAGCCDTSHMMVAEYYKHLGLDVPAISKKYVSSNLFYYGDFLRDYGMVCSVAAAGYNTEEIRSYIRSGCPVIIDLLPGGWYTFHPRSSGHFLVLMGYNNEGFYAYDPGARENTYGVGGKPVLSYAELEYGAAAYGITYYVDKPVNGIIPPANFPQNSSYFYKSESAQQVYEKLAVTPAFSAKAKVLANVYAQVEPLYGAEFAIGLMANIFSEGTLGLVEYGKSVPNWDGTGTSRTSTYSNPLVVRSRKNAQALLALADARTGVGMVQWTNGRTIGMANAYLQYCTTYSDEDLYNAELQFMLQELSPGSAYYNSVVAASNGRSAEDCAELLTLRYEIPARASQKAQERRNVATDIIRALNNN